MKQIKPSNTGHPNNVPTPPHTVPFCLSPRGMIFVFFYNILNVMLLYDSIIYNFIMYNLIKNTVYFVERQQFRCNPYEMI